ncbi:substrate-binding periplasmic protein [Pseudoalteromonas sp.]|uniref:substrate-binding periplasmic protein n=1 Tax=Pseudoalteromonas sp. TaxID=53249 RepID=UPI003565DF68
MRHLWLTNSLTLIVTLLFSIKLMAADLEMVVTEHFPPYQVKAGDKLDGVAVEIVNALLKRESIDAQHLILPWSRAYHIATQQKNVMIYSIRRTQKREDDFLWVGPIFPANSLLQSKSSLYLWQLKSFKQKKVSTNTMRNLTLVVARDDYLMDEIVTRYQWPTKNVMQVRTWPEAITALKEQRVDVIVLQKNNLIALSKFLAFDMSEFEPAVDLGRVPLLHIALSKHSNPILLKRLQQALNDLHNSQEYVLIEQKWRSSFTSEQ